MKSKLRENRLSGSTHRKVELIVARWALEDKQRRAVRKRLTPDQRWAVARVRAESVVVT